MIYQETLSFSFRSDQKRENIFSFRKTADNKEALKFLHEYHFPPGFYFHSPSCLYLSYMRALLISRIQLLFHAIIIFVNQKVRYDLTKSNPFLYIYQD